MPITAISAMYAMGDPAALSVTCVSTSRTERRYRCGCCIAIDDTCASFPCHFKARCRTWHLAQANFAIGTLEPICAIGRRVGEGRLAGDHLGQQAAADGAERQPEVMVA